MHISESNQSNQSVSATLYLPPSSNLFVQSRAQIKKRKSKNECTPNCFGLMYSVCTCGQCVSNVKDISLLKGEVIVLGEDGVSWTIDLDTSGGEGGEGRRDGW